MGKVDTRPDITKELLEEYVKQGYSQERIAVKLGTTWAIISYKMQKYGVKPARTRASKYDKKIIIKQLQNGWTIEQIAKCFGVCTETVNCWIRTHGLKQYRKESTKIKTADCEDCIYRTRDKHSLDRCSYWSIMGHSRNMGQPEEICSKYVKGGRKRGRKGLYNLQVY